MPARRHSIRPPVAAALAVALLALLAGPPQGARAEGESPGLVLDRLEHDFGAVGQEQELETSFTYRNAGAEEIAGIRALGDCGCYGVTLTDETLAPGASGTLSVKFRTLMFNGTLNKKLKLLWKGREREPIVVKLHVDVIAGVILAPGRVWFGDVLVGTQPEKTVYAKWHAAAGKAFEVTSVEVPGYDFDIRTAPYEQGDWRGTAITLAFKDAPPLGMFSATALVRTTHPDYARITLPVTANVTGKVWLQSRTVYFGWVPKGKTKTTTVLVKPFSDDVDLGAVKANSRAGRVEVEIEKHPMNRPGWWRLLVRVPEGAEVGSLEDVVEVHTAVPGEEVTEIEVRGEVLQVGG